MIKYKSIKISDFQTFNFQEKLIEIYRKVLGNEIIIGFKKQYFVSPYFEEINKINATIFSKPDLCCKENIVFGKLKEINDRCKEIDKEFIKELIASELEFFKRFLSILINHLSNRKLEEKSMISSDYIRLKISQAVKKLEEIKHLNSLFYNNERKNSVLTKQKIREINIILSRLAGGRAFLSQGIISMLYTFDLINKIYL